ncbi:hypothetical protein MTO96_025631 [Rhipicephalus appendiculatus]
MQLRTRPSPGAEETATTGHVSALPRWDDMTTTAFKPRHRITDPRSYRRSRRKHQSQRSAKYQYTSSDESEGGKSVKYLLRNHEKKKRARSKSHKVLGSTAAVPPKCRNDAVPMCYDPRQAYGTEFLHPIPQRPQIERTGRLPVAPADGPDYQRDFPPTITQLPNSVAQYTGVPAGAYAAMPRPFPDKPIPMSSVLPAQSTTMKSWTVGSEKAQLSQRAMAPMPIALNTAGPLHEFHNRCESLRICSLPPAHASIAMQMRTGTVGAVGRSVSWAKDVNWRSANSGCATTGSATETSSTNLLPIVSGSWKKGPCVACLVLCLAAAALISFWAFYATADVIIAGHDISGDSGDPITVPPQDDSAIYVSGSHGAYQYGPHQVTQKLRFGRGISVPVARRLAWKKCV